MTKPTKWSVGLAKTQISLCICPVWSVFAVRSVGSSGPNEHLMVLWHFSSSVNWFFKHACAASSRARCLIFGWAVCLLSYLMLANSEGSGETVRMRRLAWDFAGRLCDTYHNIMRWLQCFFMRLAKTLIRLGGWPGLFESSLGVKVIWLVLSWGSSFTVTGHFITNNYLPELTRKSSVPSQ